MIDFFFGWLIKPNYKVTFLDEIIFWAEAFILLVIISFTIVIIQDKKEKRRK